MKNNIKKLKIDDSNTSAEILGLQQEYHYHDGIDQPRLNPKFFTGLPIYSEVPTHTDEEGKLVVTKLDDLVILYLRLNKLWNPIGVFPGTTTYTFTLNFSAILVHESEDIIVSVPKVISGDAVMLGVQGLVISTGTNCDNISFFAWASSDTFVTIRCINNSDVNTANPATGLFTIKIINI